MISRSMPAPSGSLPAKQIHRAGWIIADHSTVIRDGYLETENGWITGVHKGIPRQHHVDHGPGVLMPAFVNTHLHLELSALKNGLPFDHGFQAWVQALLKKRQAMGQDVMIGKARSALADLRRTGTFTIGEVSTLGITRDLFSSSEWSGVFFQEYLGAGQAEGDVRKNDRFSFSLAGHAPHTTSPDLLKALKSRTLALGLPFSIHVAESSAESEFIERRKGEWADFLTSRGIDYSDWQIGSRTPVAYLHDLGLLDEKTIAVHLLQITPADLDILARSGAVPCVCPRSNRNLHKCLPDIEAMVRIGLEPSLGTDSLASCDSLNMRDETAFVGRHYPGLDPGLVFSMATRNGARALGLDHLIGTLSKGKRADFIYLDVHALHSKTLFESILFHDT